MKSSYDSYGVLKDVQWIDIPVGSIVEYTTRVSSDQKSRKVKLTGIWDGKKVCFGDKEKTVVRTSRWLTVTENFNKVK